MGGEQARWEESEKARTLLLKKTRKMVERKRADGLEVSEKEEARLMAELECKEPRPMSPVPLPEKPHTHERLHDTRLVSAFVKETAAQAPHTQT